MKDRGGGGAVAGGNDEVQATGTDVTVIGDGDGAEEGVGSSEAGRAFSVNVVTASDNNASCDSEGGSTGAGA